MLIWTLDDGSAAARPLEMPDEALIGRAAHCDLTLSGWRIAAEHVRVFRTLTGVMVENLGLMPGLAAVSIDGQRVDGLAGPLAPGSVLRVGGHALTFSRETIDEVIQPASSPSMATAQPAPARAERVDRPHETLPVTTATDPQRADAVNAKGQAPAQVQAKILWRRRIHAELIQALDLRRQDVSALSDQALRMETLRLVRELVSGLDAQIPEWIDREDLCTAVCDEAVGLGPLEPLLADDSISELMVNRHDEIYVERRGRLERHPLVFTDDAAVLAVIERIVAPLGRRIDESSPMVDARLKDGSRVHAIIPPLALKGPCLTIRKFGRRQLDAADLVRMGSLDAAMAEFLCLCVIERRNIVVSGGTGSGKTTLLNVLSNHIPLGERVITVEDAAELQLRHPHLVSLESRPANAEGRGAVGIRELVRNTLRMRPDRIVIGECRGAEALDMLQAMNTGHEGSLTTLHANTPRDALARLETLVLMAGVDLPLSAIRDQIASAVDIIVQQTRFACGARRVTSITEVTGIESGRIQTQELFRFQPRPGLDGNGHGRGGFRATGAVPDFLEALREAGRPVDLSMFDTTESRIPQGVL